MVKPILARPELAAPYRVVPLIARLFTGLVEANLPVVKLAVPDHEP